MCHINLEYYTHNLTYCIGEMVIFDGSIHKIVYEDEHGYVNLENGLFYIFGVPKMFLFKII